MYEKVKYLIEDLNLKEFYAKSHKTNKIGINSLINFHKKYIKDYYKIQTFNGEDVVNFIFKKILKLDRKKSKLSPKMATNYLNKINDDKQIASIYSNCSSSISPEKVLVHCNRTWTCCIH